MKGKLENGAVLKGVSRSFFLSLRILPVPMRTAASLAYLLARISDTLADTPTISCGTREEWLVKFLNAVASKSDSPRWPVSLLNAVSDPRERHLLECAGEIFVQFHALPMGEASLVQEVLAIICSGQLLDLRLFSKATRENPIALANDVALDDYAWRVAGSVGEFWTKLGFLTMGEQFSQASESDLIARGVKYGKGLQLVNILRDVPVDLATGRCYLPVRDIYDLGELMDCHAIWLKKAEQWVAEGESYAWLLKSLRLRVGTVLPALLACETLKLLRGVTWEVLQKRPKISRRQVYACLFRACF